MPSNEFNQKGIFEPVESGAFADQHSSNTLRTPLSGPLRKIVVGIGFFVAICVTAVFGYVSAGWELADSIYMVVITIFGVGYGEVQPVQSSGLRALTILVIIGGYAAVIYTVGGFMQMLIDGELNKALGARRMTKEIESLHKHAIVCGFGRMGSILAQELRQANKPFVIIDSNERRLKDAEDRGFLVVNGDATEESILLQAGIDRAAVIATVLSADATNVFVTITAREMNPEVMIIARGENPRTEKKLLGCGANKVVLPTAIGASKVAQLVVRPTAEDMLERLTGRNYMQEELCQIGLRFDQLQICGDSPLVNRSIGDAKVQGEQGFVIVGIRREDGTTMLNPPADTLLLAEDTVVVLGHSHDLPQLAERFSANTHQLTYRGVTIKA